MKENQCVGKMLFLWNFQGESKIKEEKEKAFKKKTPGSNLKNRMMGKTWNVFKNCYSTIKNTSFQYISLFRVCLIFSFYVTLRLKSILMVRHIRSNSHQKI